MKPAPTEAPAPSRLDAVFGSRLAHLAPELARIGAQAHDFEAKLLRSNPCRGDGVRRIAEDEHALAGEVGAVDRTRVPGKPALFRREQKLRVVTPHVTFPGLLKRSFEPIRQYGGRPVIAAALLESLELIATCTTRPEDRAAVADEARRVIAFADAQNLDEPQREKLREAYRRVLRALAPDARCTVAALHG